MHTYLEIDYQTKKECCYVSIDFSKDGNALIIKRSKGFYSVSKQKIPLEEIERLIFDEPLGVQRISFVYQNNFYYFYECGKGVIDYLQQNLFVM